MAKFCSNCGNEVDEKAIVCVRCGCSVNGGGLNGEGKSKIVAGLLGLFFGIFGVHNYYLGYNGKATAQLLITILTCGIGSIVTIPWGIVEGILILCGSINTDANGLPLKD